MRSHPAGLEGPVNARVLAHLEGRSAHSDVAEALLDATATLGDVQRVVPDARAMSFVAVATAGTVFGFAEGMRRVAFRLEPPFAERALATGGTALAEAGPGWVAFELFRDGWPELDVAFWARQAYVAAREG